jgi:nucleotide-binding universal stress UspA family protein
MKAAQSQDVPFVTSVFHPSDFSEGSRKAFAHALLIALFRRTELTLLHAGRDFLGEDEWSKFPPVRETLEHWGLLEPGSDRSAIFDEFSVRVKKANVRGRTPYAAMSSFVKERKPDLIVLATEGRDGLPSWLSPSVAEKVVRSSDTLTLFVPKEGRGFVSLEDGEITMRRILVPVDRSPSPREALVRAARIAAALGDGPVAVTALHIGDGGPLADLDFPEEPACTWQRLERSGDVVEEIGRAALEADVDLIVMPTRGRDGILDALRGSVTERVLRDARCPVLAVPAD